MARFSSPRLGRLEWCLSDLPNSRGHPRRIHLSSRDMKIITLTFLVLVFATNLYAQNDEQGGIIKTDKGILIVWNEAKNNYTLEIKGNEIRPVPGERIMFFVDHKFLQLLTIAKNDILRDVQKRDLDDRATLSAHRDWESQSLGKTFQETLKVDSSWLKLPNGTEALLWGFEMPAKVKGDAKKQVYLAVSKGEYILLLNSVVTDKIDEMAVRNLLTDTMTSLKTSEKPINFKKAQEQILKED
jgi:hypothetical protein